MNGHFYTIKSSLLRVSENKTSAFRVYFFLFFMNITFVHKSLCMTPQDTPCYQDASAFFKVPNRIQGHVCTNDEIWGKYSTRCDCRGEAGKVCAGGGQYWHFALQNEKAGKHVKVKNLLKILRLQSVQKCALETYY